MEEEKTKVNPTESYLLKRVKQLEKENKALKKTAEKNQGYFKHNQECYKGLQGQYEILKVLALDLCSEFELQTEESETFDYLRFDGSFFKTLYKELGRNSIGEQHLIKFIKYVKENLWIEKN